MLKLVVSLSLVACVLGASIPDGLVPQLQGRVVGGVETTIESFPYQISLQKNGFHTCGGSLYSSSVVVTAAHCVDNGYAWEFKVRAGSTGKSSGGILAPVASITVHPLFINVIMGYDIALLRLKTPLPLGPTIRPIKMVDDSPLDGTKVKVSGWGAMLPGSYQRPENLRYVELDIIEREKCASYRYFYGDKIKATMICAAAQGKDSCQGDSGGPLVLADGQVGIVSWGQGCASPLYPGIFTDIAVLKSWIEDNA